MDNQGWIAHKVDEVETPIGVLKTHHWYMETSRGLDVTAEQRKAIHDQYWEQFATAGIRRFLKTYFTLAELETLKEAYTAGNVNFNSIPSIPLSRWDNLKDVAKGYAASLLSKTVHAQTPPGVISWSLSDAICITKSAMAKMIREGEV